jgi:hypothetical protein
MNLFIKVIDNQVIDHPVTLENLQAIYPNVEYNNPPENYLPFNRAGVPAATTPYTVNESTYVIASNVVNEVYTQREMTDEEKEILWNEMQNRKPYDSWLLNKYSCIWEPPVEHPKDGKKYLWNEETLSWLEINQ